MCTSFHVGLPCSLLLNIILICRFCDTTIHRAYFPRKSWNICLFPLIRLGTPPPREGSIFYKGIPYKSPKITNENSPLISHPKTPLKSSFTPWHCVSKLPAFRYQLRSTHGWHINCKTIITTWKYQFQGWRSNRGETRVHALCDDYIYRLGLGNHANAGPAYRSTSKRFLHLRTTIRPSTPPGVLVISRNERNKVFRKHDWRMKNAPQEKILRILFAVSSGSTVFLCL